MIKPSYHKIYSILKEFNNLKDFTIPTKTELDIQQQKIKDFHTENDYVFCYLVDE